MKPQSARGTRLGLAPQPFSWKVRRGQYHRPNNRSTRECNRKANGNKLKMKYDCPKTHGIVKQARSQYLSLSKRKMIPKITWPASCPQPHNAPTEKLCNLDRPMQRGARAAKWSGPVNVWRPPATKPVQALASSPPPPLEISLDNTPEPACAASPPTTKLGVSTPAHAGFGRLINQDTTQIAMAGKSLGSWKLHSQCQVVFKQHNLLAPWLSTIKLLG